MFGDSAYCAAVGLFVILHVFVFVDPGPLPVQFMFKAHVEAELDKLKDEAEYTELLLLDETPPVGVQQVEDPDEEQQPVQQGGPSKRTRAASKHPPKACKTKKKNGKRPKEKHEHLRGVGEAQACAYNMSDLKEVVELSHYLSKNGGWELFTTPKNGNCLFSSLLYGVDIPEEFREDHLRFQFILWCVRNHKFAFKRLYAHILGEYGHSRISREEYLERSVSKENPLTDLEIEQYQKPGPFSFLSYLRYMLQPSSWGDAQSVSLIGMMWNITITVVQPDVMEEKGQPQTFTQIKMRHNRPLEDVDLVVVYVGQSHYLGTCKYPFQVIHVFFDVRRFSSATADYVRR